MANEIERAAGHLFEAAKAGGLGTGVPTVGGIAKAVGSLVGALWLERARRFVDYLSSAEESKRFEGEAFVSELCQRPEGQRILQHIVRDVLFGTESISIAALAALASEALKHKDDSFYPRAARALEGLRNEDAILFVPLRSSGGRVDRTRQVATAMPVRREGDELNPLARVATAHVLD